MKKKRLYAFVFRLNFDFRKRFSLIWSKVIYGGMICVRNLTVLL